MLSHNKTIIEAYFEPLIPFLAKVNPNLLTLLGSIPPLLFFVFVLTHHYIFALIIYFGNGLDMLDGMIARKFEKVTAFGGLFDSTMDRVSDFFIITAFAFGNLVRWEITAPILLLAFLTSYIRSRCELALAVHQKNEEIKNDVQFNIGLIERPERLIGIFIALLLYVLFPELHFFEINIAELVFLILFVLSLYTVCQRLKYAYQKL